MTSAFHPAWCSPEACSVADPTLEPYHRSEPIILPTDDPGVSLYLYREAYEDCSAEFLVMVKLVVADDQPWYLTEPLGGREISLLKDDVETATKAMTSLF